MTEIKESTKPATKKAVSPKKTVSSVSKKTAVPEKTREVSSVNKTKTALVTGAAGFIGHHVCRGLLKRGVKVRAMLHDEESDDNLIGLDLEIVRGDILDKDFVNKAVKGMDQVFHLAAVYAIWMSDWKPLYEVNLQGSRNLLWACVRNNVKRVIYTSSISGVGVKEGLTEADESTEFNQYEASPYIISKYLSQQEAMGFAENGLDLVIVNPAFPFGPGDIGPTPTGKIIIDILNGINRFKFKGGINVVDVRDVAEGHILAAEKGRAGEMYLLANKNLTIQELSDHIGDLEGKKIKMLELPVPLMKEATKLLQWVSDNVTQTPPLSTPKVVEYASQYLFYNIDKSKKELGYQPRDFRESLRDSISYFRSSGHISH